MSSAALKPTRASLSRVQRGKVQLTSTYNAGEKVGGLQGPQGQHSTAAPPLCGCVLVAVPRFPSTAMRGMGRPAGLGAGLCGDTVECAPNHDWQRPLTPCGAPTARKPVCTPLQCVHWHALVSAGGGCDPRPEGAGFSLAAAATHAAPPMLTRFRMLVAQQAAADTVLRLLHTCTHIPCLDSLPRLPAGGRRDHHSANPISQEPHRLHRPVLPARPAPILLLHFPSPPAYPSPPQPLRFPR